MELILSNSSDDTNEEENEEDDEDKEEEQEKVSKFFYCIWSIKYDGKDIPFKKTGNNFDSQGMEGISVTVKNDDNITCAVENGKYECVPLLDDSKHAITLSISKDGKEASLTCDIPSQKELLEKNQFENLPASFITTPRPIRFNFGEPILSPGVL